MPEVKAKLREAQDRLSESDYQVGYFYYRQVVSRRDRSLQAAAQGRPGVHRPRRVYFYLAESCSRCKREAEALPYYERLVNEFEQSEYLGQTQKRIAELKAQAAKPTT